MILVLIYDCYCYMRHIRLTVTTTMMEEDLTAHSILNLQKVILIRILWSRASDEMLDISKNPDVLWVSQNQIVNLPEPPLRHGHFDEIENFYKALFIFWQVVQEDEGNYTCRLVNNHYHRKKFGEKIYTWAIGHQTYFFQGSTQVFSNETSQELLIVF